MGSRLEEEINACDTMDCKVDKVIDRIHENARDMDGVEVNSNNDTLEILAEGLIDNYEDYGVLACPCRDIDDETGMDEVCPCDYYKDQIEEKDYCMCRMYFSKNQKGGSKNAKKRS